MGSHRRMPEKFEPALEIADDVWIYDCPAFIRFLHNRRKPGTFTNTWKKGVIYGRKRTSMDASGHYIMIDRYMAEVAGPGCRQFFWHESAIERRESKPDWVPPLDEIYDVPVNELLPFY